MKAIGQREDVTDWHSHLELLHRIKIPLRGC